MRGLIWLWVKTPQFPSGPLGKPFERRQSLKPIENNMWPLKPNKRYPFGFDPQPFVERYGPDR